MNVKKKNQLYKSLTKRQFSNKLIISSPESKEKLDERQIISSSQIQTGTDLKKIVEVLSNNNQTTFSFNKKLLKNIRKKQQSEENKSKLQSKQESKSLIPSLRKTQKISYRNIKLLRSFLTDFKKIKSRRLTKLTLKQQRQLSKSVKRARTLKLFDPRKTLKSNRFLNYEKKSGIIQILLFLQLLKLEKFMEIIRVLKPLKALKIVNYIELSMMSEK